MRHAKESPKIAPVVATTGGVKVPIIIAMLGVLFLCGIVCGYLAADKGRDGTGWFFLGLLIGPLAILAIACLNPLHPNEPGVQVSSAPPPAAAAASRTVITASIADELTKLADLRDRGVITQAELDAEKARLLA